MLSIGAIGGSGKAHNYYAKYCQEAGEAEGQWVGQAKARIGLEGSVSADTMKELLAGFDGRGNKLVKNAGREDRRGGFDLTFSAPKSVSVVWAGANEAMRERIESEFKGACQDALSYLQDFEGFSRKGVNGQEKVKAELLGSLFLHSSNREGEPNLHGHLVLKNLGYCEDGVWRTIDGMGIFKSKMAAGNVHKASFASRLQSLGFSVRQTKDSFEIDGVKQTVCQAMSTRSQQIEAYLKEKWGLTREQASAKQLQVAALDTRQGKEAVENRRDFLKWQTKLSEHGFTRQSVEFLQQGGANKKKFTSKVKNEAISTALERITAQHSTFTQRQLHSEIVKELIGKASPAQIDLCLRTVVDSAQVVRLADDRFTSIGVQAMERGLVRSILNRLDEGRHLISEASLAKVLSDRKTLSLEQTAVLKHLASDRSAVSMVRGYAGAGKSFTMGAVADAYRLDGYRVIGLSPSNKAKIGLSDSIKADAHTLDSFAMRLENKHTRLGPKDVLIIDEAAMASSKKLQPIIEKVNVARAKLIFVGDESQLQPIDAGQLFGTLYQKLSGVELKEIYRQERVSEAKAIVGIRDGKILEALQFYSERRSVDYDKLGQEAAFKKLHKLQKDTHKLVSQGAVLTSSQADTRALNHEFRGYLVDHGFLKDGIIVNGREYAKGEQIAFTETNRRLGISKGETARIVDITGTKISVKTQSGERVSIDSEKFQGFFYGYAMSESQFRAERGLHIEANMADVRDKLVDDWSRFAEEHPEKTSLIIASTNRSVDSLNEAARKVSIDKGIVTDSRSLVLKGSSSIDLGIGDKVVMTATSRFEGYAKNDLATVVAFEGDKIKLKSHDGREFYFNPVLDDSIKHGYAITAHKAQGDTVDRVFIAIDSNFINQELFYVQVSRSRNASQIYCSKDFLGDLSSDDKAYLKSLSSDRAKGEYFRLYRQKLADVIKGTSVKDTSQDYSQTKDIQTPTRAESLKDMALKLEQLLKPISDKVYENKAQKKLRKKFRGMAQRL